MALEPNWNDSAPVHWHVTRQSTRHSLVPRGGGMSNIAWALCSWLGSVAVYCNISTIVCPSSVELMCIVSFVSFLVCVDNSIHPVRPLPSFYPSDRPLFFFSVSVSCCLLSPYSSPQFRAIYQVQPLNHSSSTATSLAISFLSFAPFSCRLTCCHHLSTHTLSLFPYLWGLFLCRVSCFHPRCVTKCTSPCLTRLHLCAGQQPEGGQCAQTVDHRGPRASSQETLLLRTLSGRHAVRTHHQQASHRHRFLGRALWIQQPASRPQPTPSSIQGDRQEETQGTREIWRATWRSESVWQQKSKFGFCISFA